MEETAVRPRSFRDATGTSRILVMGMYRSGTTRLYNIVREALLTAHGDALMTGHHREADLERMLEASAPCVFKDHEPTARVVDRIVTGDLVAVGAVRQPLDAMVSFAATFSWPVDEIITRVDASVQSMEQLHGHIAVLRYADVTSGNPLVIRRILRLLSIDASIPRAAVLACHWSRRRGFSLSRDPGRQADGTSWDPVTLFHPNHVGGRGDRRVGSDVRRRLETAVVDLDLVARVARLTPGSDSQRDGQ
jgi:hypothetical protein